MERALARLVSARRITEAGDFIVILDVPPAPRAHGYREPRTPQRLRRIVRLDARVAASVEDAQDIPVLIKPESRTIVALDFDALLTDPEAGEAVAKLDLRSRVDGRGRPWCEERAPARGAASGRSLD